MDQVSSTDSNNDMSPNTSQPSLPFDPDNPVYEICGIPISLRGGQPDTLSIRHFLPKDLKHFGGLCREGKQFDVIIRIGDKEIPAHKSLLSDRIPYFSALLTPEWMESSSGIITLDLELNTYIVELLLAYAYSGFLTITKENVQCLMKTADFFNIESILDECANFMRKRIRYDDALSLLKFFRSIGYSKMDEILFRFIDTNFVPISLTSEFIDLSVDDLSMILSRDSLHVDEEKQVFEAVDRWIGRDEEREKFGPRLLKLIRCTLLPYMFIHEIVKKTQWVENSEECIDIVDEARSHKINKSFKHSERFCDYAHRLIFSTGRSKCGPFEIYDPLRNEYSNGQVEERELYMKRAVMDNKIMFVGQWHGGGEFSEGNIIIYDTRTNKWDEVDAPGRLGWLLFESIEVIGRKVYSAGGECGDIKSRSLHAIDPFLPNSEWKRLADMKRERSRAASCVLNGKLFVIGGNRDENVWWSDGEFYDPETDIWTRIASMKRVRAGCAAAVFKGEIYVAGGFDRYCPIYSDFEKYSPTTNTWTTLKSMNTARRSPTLVVSGGMIYAIGGWDRGALYMQSVERYDPEIDNWEDVPSMCGLRNEPKIVCALSIPASFPTPL